MKITVDYSAFHLPYEVASDVSDDLRAIRLMHWQQTRRYSQAITTMTTKIQNERGSPKNNQLTLEKLRRRYVMHIKAVQTLNIFFEIGDTAEQDAAK